MHYLLYKHQIGATYSGSIEKDLKIQEFTPKPFRLFADWEKQKDLATFIFRSYISILTFGKTKLFCIIDNNNQVRHSAYVIPKNIKYSFLKKGEYSIGPCNTPESYRGQGLYPYMLNYITSRDNHSSYYVFIREDNQASRRGAEKAGFVMCYDRIKDTKVLKIFKLVKEKNSNE